MQRAVFKNYPEERLLTRGIASRLGDAEWRLRQRILEELVARKRPLPLPDLVPEAASEHRLLASLEAKKAVVTDSAGRIAFAYPVSAQPTQHKVSLADGRSFFSMCAIDALGAHFTFRQDVTIASCCTKCAAPVSVAISGGALTEVSPGGLHLLHVDLLRNDNWSGAC